MFSHKQGVKNNQIQLFVDPEVSSKEAILKFTEMILLLLSYFFKNHFTGPIGPMVGKYNLIIDDSFFFTFFPLPQTSQPVTFPDGSLAQEGSEPCRPRWLVSWVDQG